VQLAEVAIGAVVDLVVELREPDLPLEADLRAAGDELARDVTDSFEIPRRPGECLEGRRRRVADSVLKR